MRLRDQVGGGSYGLVFLPFRVGVEVEVSLRVREVGPTVRVEVVLGSKVACASRMKSKGFRHFTEWLPFKSFFHRNYINLVANSNGGSG